MSNNLHRTFCPRCQKEEKKLLKIKGYQEEIDRFYGEGEYIINPNGYVNRDSLLNIQHSKCGEYTRKTIRTVRGNIKEGLIQCENCRVYANRWESAKEEIKGILNGGDFILKDVKGKFSMKVQHVKCGEEFWTPRKYRSSKSKRILCLKCDDPEELYRGSIFPYFTLESKYYTQDESKNRTVKIKHIECGNEFKAHAEHFKREKECPYCREIVNILGVSEGEYIIGNLLDSIGVNYMKEKTFETCVNPNTGKRLRYDFYIQEGDREILLEYDGEQHFRVDGYLIKTEDELRYRKFRDELKDKWAEDNGIPLERLNYKDFDYLEDEVLSILEDYLIIKQ